MKIRLVLTAAVLFTFQHVRSQGYWTQKDSFPAIGRELPFSFSIGNKGYVGGGARNGYLTDFWEYDPAANAWNQKSDFAGTGRFASVTFSINGKGYVTSGGTCCWFNDRDLWEYDPVIDVWSQQANFPGTPRSGAGAFSIGNKGYLACGTINGSTHLNDLWEWDQLTNTWIQLSPLPGPGRYEPDGFAINGKGYLVGGDTTSQGYSHDTWQYDTTLNSWTRMAYFPGVGRGDAVAFAICGKGYYGTGETPLQNDWWMFDPVSNQWIQKINVPGPKRDDCPAFVIGDKGYLGLGDITTALLTDFWEFTPDSSCTGVPVSSFVPSDTTFCGEGQRCINFFDHSANNPTSWQWLFPGAMPDTSTQQNPPNICYNQTGTYSVTLIAANSSGTDTLTISPMVIFSSGPNLPTVTVIGDTLISSSASQYLWYFNGAPIAGATDSFYIATSAGTYAVLTSDSLGCSKISNGVFINAVIEINTQPTIIISPNPLTSSSTIQLSTQVKNAEVVIYDMVGKELFRKKFAASNPSFGGLTGDPEYSGWKIERGSLESGVYFVRVVSEERQWVQKLVVE